MVSKGRGGCGRVVWRRNVTSTTAHLGQRTPNYRYNRRKMNCVFDSVRTVSQKWLSCKRSNKTDSDGRENLLVRNRSCFRRCILPFIDIPELPYLRSRKISGS